MNAIPNKSDYVRYTLYSAGITLTDEQVEQIYATGYPYEAVDALVASFHVYREDIAEQTRKLYADVCRVTPEQIGELKESNLPYAESQYRMYKSRFVGADKERP